MNDYAFSYLRLTNVSRSCSYLKGSSSVAAVAYILCTCMTDVRTGNICDWHEKNELIASNTKLPDNCTEEYTKRMESSPEELWNEVENAEKNVNARAAKEIVIGLPAKAQEHWKAMACDMAQYFTANGHAVTWAIHDKGDGNPHIHMCVTSRRLENDKWVGIKYKKVYALNETGERIPIIDPKTGKQKLDTRNRKLWKRINKSVNELDKKDFNKKLKRKWATIANQYLDGEKVDFEHYKQEGYIPQIHQGNAVTEMKRKGYGTRVSDVNSRIREFNAIVYSINILKEDIRKDMEILEAIRIQIINLRNKIISFFAKMCGYTQECAQAYEQAIEKAESDEEPNSKMEKLIANNMSHGIDPLDRIRENLSASVPSQCKMCNKYKERSI